METFKEIMKHDPKYGKMLCDSIVDTMLNQIIEKFEGYHEKETLYYPSYYSFKINSNTFKIFKDLHISIYVNERHKTTLTIEEVGTTFGLYEIESDRQTEIFIAALDLIANTHYSQLTSVKDILTINV